MSVRKGAATAGADSAVRRTILVVEDNSNLLAVLGILLDYEQYRCVLTADGQEALAWLAHRRPALVILDWLLPGINGGTVLEATRARYGTTVPILVLSAVADTSEVRLAGADAYLRKPYTIPDLVSTIQRLLAAFPTRQRCAHVVPPPSDP
jgi:two-component system phosphate regulon response regulator PhoB